MIYFTLPWPDSRLSPNSRTHWRPKAEAAKVAKRTAFYMSLQAQPDDGAMMPDLASPHVLLRFHPVNRGRRDLDNAIASCKAYLDGIAASLKVDDSKFRLSAQMDEPRQPPCVEVVIT